MRGIYLWIKMYAHTRLFMMLWWLWVVVGWSKRRMVSRWQGSKSWAWPVSGTAPLHTWVFTSAHAPFLVHLCTWTYLHTCVVFTCILFHTPETQHHQRIPRLCKYTSANSLDNNSQSERIPCEEGSRVQIGQNAMALEGGSCLLYTSPSPRD